MITSAQITFPCGQVLEAEVHTIGLFGTIGPIVKVGVKQTPQLASLLSSLNKPINLKVKYRNIPHSLMVIRAPDETTENLVVFKPIKKFI